MKITEKVCVMAATLGLLFFSGCNQEQKSTDREITGTIYIMTAGAETIRLPMVQIVAFDIATNDAQKIISTERQKAEQRLGTDGKDLVEHYAAVNFDRLCIQAAREAHNVGTNTDALFENAKTNLTIAISEWGQWQNEIQPAYFTDNAYKKMGEPIPISTTDADGKFTTHIKKTDTLVAATAQRQTPAGKETYFWLIPIPAGDEKRNIEFNNKNLLAYSAEAQQLIQKTTTDASKMRDKIQTWFSEEPVQ